jgi:hypothetical protein
MESMESLESMVASSDIDEQEEDAVVSLFSVLTFQFCGSETVQYTNVGIVRF